MEKAYLLLMIAIISEVIATLSLKASDGFSQLLPSIIVVIGYAIAFYCLSIVVQSLPLGLTYAIWTGLGTVLITLFGLFLYQQQIDFAAWLGILLIIAGIIVIQLFSKSFVNH